jgi:hypothetical protein
MSLVNQTHLEELASAYGLDADEVRQALNERQQGKLAGAVTELRSAMMEHSADSCVRAGHEPRKLVAAAHDRIQSLHVAAARLSTLAGIPIPPAPSALLQEKVRAQAAVIDRMKLAVAAASADPKMARAIRACDQDLPQVSEAIKAIVEFRS